MALIDKLTAIANGFRESRGTTAKLSLDEMAVLASEKVGGGDSGESKLAQYWGKTLEELTFEETQHLTAISDSQFYEFHNLKTVEIATPITYIYSKSFMNCENLETVRFSPDCRCETIQEYAFANCKKLKGNITMPNQIGQIYNNTFLSCWEIEGVILPDGVTAIGNYAFNACRKLSSINALNDVVDIKMYAFSNCYKLPKIIIGSKIVSIGQGAFIGCSSLESVTIYATTPPKIESDTFFVSNSSGAVMPSTCKFYVPAESLEAYKTATNWSNYADKIFAIEEV